MVGGSTRDTGRARFHGCGRGHFEAYGAGVDLTFGYSGRHDNIRTIGYGRFQAPHVRENGTGGLTMDVLWGAPLYMGQSAGDLAGSEDNGASTTPASDIGSQISALISEYGTLILISALVFVGLSVASSTSKKSSGGRRRRRVKK